MRAGLRQRLVALVGDEVVEVEHTDEVHDIGRKLMVDRFGAQCSGWLMFAHREQLHGAGAVDFRIPKKHRAKLPMWFALAMAFLEKSAGFEVEKRNERSLLVWRVKWKSRGYWQSLIERMRAPS
jgi:hypothetical protein